MRSLLRTTTAVVGCIAVTACGDPVPSAQVTNWNFAPDASGKGYVFDSLVRAHNGVDGWYSARLYIDYESGCRAIEAPEVLMPIKMQHPEDVTHTFRHRVATDKKVARVKYTLTFRSGDAPPSDLHAESLLYTDTRVLNAEVQLPDDPPACPRPGSEQNNRADGSSREERAATIINLNGYLCGKVLDAYNSGGGTITVHCTEYRDGRGRAKYKIHTNSGTVERLD